MSEEKTYIDCQGWDISKSSNERKFSSFPRSNTPELAHRKYNDNSHTIFCFNANFLKPKWFSHTLPVASFCHSPLPASRWIHVFIYCLAWLVSCWKSRERELEMLIWYCSRVQLRKKQTWQLKTYLFFSY